MRTREGRPPTRARARASPLGGVWVAAPGQVSGGALVDPLTCGGPCPAPAPVPAPPRACGEKGRAALGSPHSSIVKPARLASSEGSPPDVLCISRLIFSIARCGGRRAGQSQHLSSPQGPRRTVPGKAHLDGRGGDVPSYLAAPPDVPRQQFVQRNLLQLLCTDTDQDLSSAARCSSATVETCTDPSPAQEHHTPSGHLSSLQRLRTGHQRISNAAPSDSEVLALRCMSSCRLLLGRLMRPVQKKRDVGFPVFFLSPS
jgi:hypothetical protein